MHPTSSIHFRLKHGCTVEERTQLALTLWRELGALEAATLPFLVALVEEGTETGKVILRLPDATQQSRLLVQQACDVLQKQANINSNSVVYQPEQLP